MEKLNELDIQIIKLLWCTLLAEWCIWRYEDRFLEYKLCVIDNKPQFAWYAWITYNENKKLQWYINVDKIEIIWHYPTHQDLFWKIKEKWLSVYLFEEWTVLCISDRKRAFSEENIYTDAMVDLLKPIINQRADTKLQLLYIFNK